MTLRTATLVGARMLSPTVRELTLDPGPGFAFEPGQWISLRIPQPSSPEPLARAYSIASWPRADGRIELAVTRVEAGPGSTYLHAIEPGTRLPMTEAQGYFTMPARPLRPVLLVATGTGVAPLRSMLYAALQRGDATRFALLLGARTPDELLYRDAFERAAGEHPGFQFVPTLSRPDDAWAGRTGYVQLHVPELVRALGPCDVYVCGLKDMIRAVRQVLKDELGFTREHIHTERYD